LLNRGYCALAFQCDQVFRSVLHVRSKIFVAHKRLQRRQAIKPWFSYAASTASIVAAFGWVWREASLGSSETDWDGGIAPVLVACTINGTSNRAGSSQSTSIATNQLTRGAAQ